jgi:hypothetical protein
MSDNVSNRKTDFVRLIMSDIQAASSDAELTKEFLESEGVNVANMQAEGLKRIKKMQLMISAEHTKADMRKASSVAAKALAMAEQLLSDASFSLAAFMQKEGLLVSYSNFEANSPEDVKAILVKHYTLKLMNEDDDTGAQNI